MNLKTVSEEHATSIFRVVNKPIKKPMAGFLLCVYFNAVRTSDIS
jgi:hypothetical protein